MTTDTDNKKASAQPENVRIDKVTLERLDDDSPDLSWLEQTDKEMGEGFEAQSKARLESYGDSWFMIGIRAKAQVSYPCGPNGERRLDSFTSGGLWGIESDSGESYLKSIEADELEDLASHLNRFGFECSADSLKKLIQ